MEELLSRSEKPKAAQRGCRVHGGFIAIDPEGTVLGLAFVHEEFLDALASFEKVHDKLAAALFMVFGYKGFEDPPSVQQ